MIKAVVFDFGGVQTTTTMPERVHTLVDRLGLPWQPIVNGYRKYRHDYDGGFITLDEVYRRTWADAGLPVPAEHKQILEADVASYLYRNERTLAWMRTLKSRGFEIGILTNMAPDFEALYREKFADFVELASAIVVSGAEHLFKPQREIYDLLRERIALPAETLLFVDDLEENCAGACAAGWQALLFESNEQAERDFERLVVAEGRQLP